MPDALEQQPLGVDITASRDANLASKAACSHAWLGAAAAAARVHDLGVTGFEGLATAAAAAVAGPQEGNVGPKAAR
eukprot:scaffold127510_cov20-Tisochrysis_lutea.AAC.1